jgi:D-sedoheptulose 7-phosphate isomerase
MSDIERERVFADAVAATIALHERVMRERQQAVLQAASVLGEAVAAGRTVLVCGNGGSAADAQHFAAELVGRFTRERAAWPAIALSTDTSVLTAVGNDYGFERIFARQVEAHGRPGDVLVGISTSGRSPNVLAALDAARARGMETIALTGGDGGEMGARAGIHVNVPSGVTARVQEVHITLLHVLCELLEGRLAGQEQHA